MRRAGAGRPRRTALRAALPFALALALLGGCAATPYQGPLYQWGPFPRQQYETLLREGASPVEQVRTLEAHAEKARALGAALPPGFRAHLGMLALGLGDPDRAAELWIAEKQAFPEATPFMERLLARLAKGPPADAGRAP